MASGTVEDSPYDDLIDLDCKDKQKTSNISKITQAENEYITNPTQLDLNRKNSRVGQKQPDVLVGYSNQAFTDQVTLTNTLVDNEPNLITRSRNHLKFSDITTNRRGWFIVLLVVAVVVVMAIALHIHFHIVTQSLADVNECASQPCLHNGDCINGVNSFQCQCAPGYLGLTCEIDFSRCQSNPCLNGGKCIPQVNSYTCLCPFGHTGQLCQSDLSGCHSKPCANGGECEQLVNNFTCHCRPGFNGTYCDIEIDNCDSQPCRNGGKCSNAVNSYKCACAKGYLGDTCEIVAIDCQEYYFNGYRLDGVYYIRPRGIEFEVPVYCELMDGGWTRIQRRDEGLVNFNLNWEGTKQGFGNVSGEHWLGNEIIHYLTKQANYSMRWDLKGWNGNTIWAMWQKFAIGPESDGYRLTVSGHSGTMGFSFITISNGMKWTTSDRDNDLWGGNCATSNWGPWWYKNCYSDNLNNLYWVGATCHAGDCYKCIHACTRNTGGGCPCNEVLSIRATTIKLIRLIQ